MELGGPLAGMKVVDFANGLAGPLAGMVLADLGADVIKVEGKGRGDLTRDLSPMMFATANRNKRSLALDLKTPSGREIAQRLIARADVLVESFRPGIMDGFGLGCEEMCARHRRLVYASISGFGSRSADRSRRAVDAIAQAESGMIAANEGIEAPFTVVDTSTGMILAQAVLAALVRRERTGRGGAVEATLLSTALSLQAVQLADYSQTGVTLTPTERSRRAPTTGVFEAADGALYVAAHYEEHWRALAEVLDAAELLDDDRFVDRAARVRNRTALHDLLARQFAQRDRAAWCALLTERGVMAAPVRTHAEVINDETLSQRGWLHTDLRPALTALPYTLDRETMPIRTGAPPLGEHSDEVLAELGYEGEQRAALLESGVVEQCAHDDCP